MGEFRQFAELLIKLALVFFLVAKCENALFRLKVVMNASDFLKRMLSKYYYLLQTADLKATARRGEKDYKKQLGRGFLQL